MVAAWIAQLARGVLALALGITITLTLAHPPAFGLVAFGAFALLSGAVVFVGVTRGAYAGRMRAAFLAHALVTIAAGAVALSRTDGGVAFLGLVVGAWALVAGLLEGASGLLARRTSTLARDWLITGVLTLAFGVVALVIPPDLAQSFAGENGPAGTLTASVVLIGALGAWSVLVGVLQAISAFTIRGARRTRVAS